MAEIIPILMYHQVDRPPASGTPMRGMVVSPQRFAAQMRMLRLLGYQGLSMRALEPYLAGERRGRVVGITFDDGYQNNLTHALPVLQAHGFSATLYAVSQALGGKNHWDAAQGVPLKALLSAAELRQWLAAGMDVGAHSRHHVDLTRCDAATAEQEILLCKHELEAALDGEVRHFCYPYGRYQATHAALARHAGYRSATTVQRGRARTTDDPFALPRVLVAQSTHLGHFLLKLLSRYEDRRR